jgi:hypothetical protein
VIVAAVVVSKRRGIAIGDVEPEPVESAEARA